MALATYQDANGHLDGTKIAFASDLDAAPEASDADRYIKGALYGAFPTHALLWDANPTPPQEQTPALIALVAGLIMASERYRKKYALEYTTTAAFADMLQAKADDILTKIQDGELELYDTTYTVNAETLNATDFWPNDSTVATDDKPQVGFATGDRLIIASIQREF